jgi:hypothetical protein
MIKATISYQLSVYKILELIVNSKSIFSVDRYNNMCPISILKSGKSVLPEEITHSRALEQPPTHVPIYDENEEE